jgi:hypothetical protein
VIGIRKGREVAKCTMEELMFRLLLSFVLNGCPADLSKGGGRRSEKEEEEEEEEEEHSKEKQITKRRPPT